jgi:hypothetical protein
LTYFQFFLAMVILLLLPLSRFVRGRGCAIAIALAFLVVQFWSLDTSLNNRARNAIAREIEAGNVTQHPGQTLKVVIRAQKSARYNAMLAGIGLLVTVICWTGAPRAEGIAAKSNDSQN